MPQSLGSNRTLDLRHALCVGVGTYTQLANYNLRYAVADAEAIAEKLADPQRGNFAVTCLTEPIQTTKAALDGAVEQLLSAPDRQAEDLTLLYFSCHGDVKQADNTFCLLPSNATRNDNGILEQTTLIGIHDIARWFAKARTHNIVLLMDVCHSGGAGTALQHFKLDLNAGPNYFILGAARQDRIAEQSSTLEHGLFTHCLLRAFGQPPTKDGWLTISQIQNFVGEEIKCFSVNNRPTQIQGSSVFVNPQLPLLKNPGYPELYPLPPFWNVPWVQNPFFTGQEHLLSQLASLLQSEQKAALTQPLAIHGLGGIGKTELALEYAYRHRQDYHAVLWGHADSREALTSTFVSIAYLLDLPQKDEKDQMVTVEAVKAWLANRPGWLLILDNADELGLVQEFIPSALRGHLLLTTRTQAVGGLAKRIEVQTMDTDVGALLLLRRAGLIAQDALLESATPTDIVVATAITHELGGLPLALDQAGAYIEAIPCSLLEYQTLYRTHRAKLLSERGGQVSDHPEPVATTWSLSFQKVEQQNAAAADLLRFCAYLAPDPIPEEIIITGAEHLGPLLQSTMGDPFTFHQALAILGAYSLVHREVSKKTVSVHRLVQAVLKEQMDGQSRQQWAERTVLAVNAAYPSGEYQTWSQCEQVLPHALISFELIEQNHLILPEAAQLLCQTGDYLREHARYQEAGPLLQRALAICEQQWGPQHPYTAIVLNNLASLYNDQGKYEQAEPLQKRALVICEQQLGLQHPGTATNLNNLAMLYLAQGKNEQAESLLERALTIREQHLGPQHSSTAQSLDNLANLYASQGKSAQAEALYQQALSIWEQLGSQHLDTATCLNNLALLYKHQGKYEQAEPLLKRALAIWEQQLGQQHPKTASSLNGLALLYQAQGKYEQAEPLLERARDIMMQQVGPQHPHTVGSLINLADLYMSQSKYEQAEPLYQKVLTIREQQLGPQHPDTAIVLNNLALLYNDQRKYKQAEPLLEQVLTIQEQQLGLQHPNTIISLNNLAILYVNQGKYEQAESLLVRAVVIREQQLRAWHFDTVLYPSQEMGEEHSQVDLLVRQGRMREAQTLCEQSLHFYTVLGDGRSVVVTQNVLADLLVQQGKMQEAQVLYGQALHTTQELGDKHGVAMTLTAQTNLLVQLSKNNRLSTDRRRKESSRGIGHLVSKLFRRHTS